MSESTEGLMAYCRANARVCPMPQRWSALWELLPNRTRVGAGWQPPLPLILGAWDVTFETLNRDDFLQSVKEAFPTVDWDKAYQEFKAAGQADSKPAAP